MRFVIAYDVRQDSARSRVARRLERAGPRTQGSVFLVDATEEEVRSLVRELGALIHSRTDCVQAWKLLPSQPAQGIHAGRVRDLSPASVIAGPGGIELVSRKENR